MALKDILADKTKKRTLAILGTIIIILACAGVFWYQAASTPVKTVEEKKPAEEAEEAAPPPENVTVTHYHEERDGTVPSSGPAGILSPDRRNQEYEHFIVDPEAKKLVVTVSSDKDVDLYLLHDDEIQGESATAEHTETVEITSPEAGDWDADILHWSLVPMPFNEAEYHLVIDIYY